MIFERLKWTLGEGPRKQREMLEFEARAAAIAKDLRKSKLSDSAKRVAQVEYNKVIKDEAQVLLQGHHPQGIWNRLQSDFTPAQINTYFDNPNQNEIRDNILINRGIFAIRMIGVTGGPPTAQEARDLLDHQVFAGRVQPPTSPNAGDPIDLTSWDPANHA